MRTSTLDDNRYQQIDARFRECESIEFLGVIFDSKIGLQGCKMGASLREWDNLFLKLPKWCKFLKIFEVGQVVSWHNIMKKPY